jgi:hypothetical protein
MPEVLLHFDEPQPVADGRIFTAQVMAGRLTTGLWEAWIEFHPRAGGDPIRTARETEQLSRGDLRFWAAGITRGYLQRALMRALTPVETLRSAAQPAERSGDDGEALNEEIVLETNRLGSDEPVLDPIAVYSQSGEYTLRQELRALDAQQLGDIIAAYAIEEMDVTDLARTYEDALAERIVAGVQHNVGARQPDSSRGDTPIAKQLRNS